MASELLPEPRGPAADGHLVAGDVQVDPLEVVLPRPPDDDRVEALLRRLPPLARAAVAPGRGRRADLALRVGVKDPREGRAGVAGGDLRHLLGRPLGDDPAAPVAPLGPQVDHPVGRLDDVEVVLDDDHRVALLLEPVEHLQQLADVVEVEPGGRLVEDVERLAGAPA